LLKGGHAQCKDETGHDVTVQEFYHAIDEWKAFIEWVHDWRAGRFTMTLSEWRNLPEIGHTMIRLHDKIRSEIKPKSK